MAGVLAVKCQGRGLHYLFVRDCEWCWRKRLSEGRDWVQSGSPDTLETESAVQRSVEAKSISRLSSCSVEDTYTPVQRIGRHVLKLIGRGLLISFYLTCTNVTQFLFFSLKKG